MVAPDLGYLLRLPGFEHLEAATVDEAVSLLAQHKGQARVIAGGTDLLVLMKKRRLAPRYLINVKPIRNLDYIRFSPQSGLVIGALACLQSIANSAVVKGRFDLLATACNKIGTPQVRNMGTIGGNIGTGGPSQDSIPALLVLGAKLRLVSTDGERMLPVEDCFLAPFQTAIGETELLTEIQIPVPPPKSAGSYRWLTKLTAVDETLVGVAVLLVVDPKDNSICQDIRIGLGSVAPVPFRAKRAEELLRGEKLETRTIEQVAETAAAETRPRSQAGYRREMTALLVAEAINEALEKMK